MTPHGVSPDLFSLVGQIAVITGGVGRLGSQYAKALVTGGASVALFDVAKPGPIVRELLDSDAPVSAHVVDTTDRAAVGRAMDEVVARLGAPTVLVNNAGLSSSPADSGLETGRFERYPESAWDAMMQSHLKSAFLASQAFLAAFRAAKREGGSIINISSTYGLVSPDQS